MNQKTKSSYRLKYISGLIFLSFSSYLIYSALQWNIYTDLGPGPGLLPLLLGGSLLVLSGLWLLKICPGDADSERKISKSAYLRMGVVILLYLFAIFGMETLGFPLTAFIITAVSMYVLGRHNWFLIIGIALATSLFCVLVFQKF